MDSSKNQKTPRTSDSANLFPEAFPEHVKIAPINPQQDFEFDYKTYRYGYEPVPMQFDHEGSRLYQHPKAKPELDRINPHYYHQIQDILPAGGWIDRPSYSSRWRKLLDYHYGSV
eukprot:Filipodium_phascolosomae@DN1800_c0_g1_i2.p1